MLTLAYLITVSLKKKKDCFMTEAKSIRKKSSEVVFKIHSFIEPVLRILVLILPFFHITLLFSNVILIDQWLVFKSFFSPLKEKSF